MRNDDTSLNGWYGPGKGRHSDYDWNLYHNGNLLAWVTPRQEGYYLRTIDGADHDSGLAYVMYPTAEEAMRVAQALVELES